MSTSATPNFEAAITATLEKTSRQYLQHGLMHLLAEPETEADHLQTILNVQGALEAVTKLHQLKSVGWRSVVEPKHHNWSDTKLLSALAEGTLKTVKYQQSKTLLIERKELPEDEINLLDKLQRLRNSIAHLGLPTLPTDLKEEITKLTVRVLNSWMWETRPKKRPDFLENQMTTVLGGFLFQKLKSDPTYVSEVMDFAYEKGEKVRNCPECRVEAWAILSDDEDEIFCFCCGYRAFQQMISFANCPACSSKANFLHDALNWREGNPVEGLCLSCWQKLEIKKCAECDDVSINDQQRKCPGCEEPYQRSRT